MNIIRARNHRGIQLIGVGENADECGRSLLASASRSKAESCEVGELITMIAILPMIEDWHGEGAKTIEGMEHWRVLIQ